MIASPGRLKLSVTMGFPAYPVTLSVRHVSASCRMLGRRSGFWLVLSTPSGFDSASLIPLTDHVVVHRRLISMRQSPMGELARSAISALVASIQRTSLPVGSMEVSSRFRGPAGIWLRARRRRLVTLVGRVDFDLVTHAADAQARRDAWSG